MKTAWKVGLGLAAGAVVLLAYRRAMATSSDVLALRFADGKQLDDWMQAQTNDTFLGWFRANVQNKGAWAGVQSNASDDTFETLWTAAAGVVYGDDGNGAGASLAEILTLTTLMMNETGGTLSPISETVGKGVAGHPGLAYPFDAFTLPSGIHKGSYNAAPWTAFRSFNDPIFQTAHGSKASATLVIGTTDPVWKGSVYPQATVPTSTDPAITGFIQEADFFKFRGRGFIQTTFRANYKPILAWIQTYNGNDPTIVRYRDLWGSQADADSILSASSNADWDALFQHTNGEVAMEAIALHNRAGGGYLFVSSDRDTLLGTGPNSAYHAARIVSGDRSGVYESLVQARVKALVVALLGA